MPTTRNRGSVPGSPESLETVQRFKDSTDFICVNPPLSAFDRRLKVSEGRCEQENFFPEEDEGGMEKDLSKALIDFYHKLLQPEFAGIKEKLKENDEKFMEMLGHLDGVHKRLADVEAIAEYI
jgi:hypothetical protein